MPSPSPSPPAAVTKSDEEQVEGAIVSSATNADPSQCTELNTQAFMEQATKEDGRAAVEACEEEAENGEGADAVGVSKVRVDGSEATAVVTVTGTVFDGQTLEVAVVEDGDRWKVDEFVRIVEFDRGRLIENFEREVAGEGEAGSPLEACFVETFEEDSRAEIEELLLSSSPKGFEEVVEACP